MAGFPFGNSALFTCPATWGGGRGHWICVCWGGRWGAWGDEDAARGKEGFV